MPAIFKDWLKTIVVLGGIVVAAAGNWTTLMLSINTLESDFKHTRQLDSILIAANKTEIDKLKDQRSLDRVQRNGDRETVIELKSDVKNILKSLQAIEGDLKYIRRKGERRDDR